MSELKVDVIYQNDWIKGISRLPDACVDSIVTSPPYYGKRDYGHSGQLGLEDTPEEFLQKIVDGFMSQCYRVLKPTGTMFINFGDGWWGNKGANGQDKVEKILSRTFEGKVINKKHQRLDMRIRPTDRTHKYIKPKDLIGMPWLLALALRNGKWNMPECIEVCKVIDRIVKSYGDELIPYNVHREILKILDEYSYVTKKGFFLRNDIIWNKLNPHPESCHDRFTNAHEYIFFFSKSRKKYYWDADAVKELCSEKTNARVSKEKLQKIADGEKVEVGSSKHEKGSGIKSNSSFENATAGIVKYRNKRDVWTSGTNSAGGDHIASFNESLIAPAILAGCPKGGIVLDPFMGKGTTAIACRKLDRRYIGFELTSHSMKEQQDYFNREFGFFL